MTLCCCEWQTVETANKCWIIRWIPWSSGVRLFVHNRWVTDLITQLPILVYLVDSLSPQSECSYLLARFAAVWSHNWNIYTSNISIKRACTDSLWIKPTDAPNSNFIGITTLHVSGSLSAHHQEFLAVHRLWYILCSCDDHLLPGVGWHRVHSVPSYSW